MALEPCPACGAPLAGREGCQAAFDELNARSWSSPGRGAMHNLIVDAYAMQHPEEYGRSAKSYIRHLSALGCLLEHPGDDRLYWATPREGPFPAIPPKPPPLTSRGSMTVADLRVAKDDAEFQALARAWAASVWAAYAPQHGLAREFLAAVRKAIG